MLYWLMDDLLDKLGETSNWKDLLRSSCKMNKLCTSLAGELTPSKLNLLRERFKKAYDLNQELFSESWIQHEMRAFNWILLALSAIKNVRIDEFGPQQWHSLRQIFSKKSPSFLHYETRRFLLEKQMKNKNWAPDQNEVLIDIIAKYDQEKIPWNEVARRLFEESQEKYFRSAKHCREHWLNYLDPSKNRGEWTQEQDFELLERVVEDGKKWAKIGVLLHRTEHCIKNRFNSILAKQKKLTPNIRREEKLVEQAKKSLQPSVPGEVESPKYKVKIKLSSESMFDDNRSFNRDHCMTFQEFEPKNSLDYLQNYSIEGGEFVRHLVKEDEEGGNNRNEGSFLPSFWASSPKNLTPIGISPSPLSLNCGLNYYIQNFNMQLQRQNEKEDPKN